VDALTAYQALLRGDVEPIAAILAPDVEWNESIAGRPIGSLRGRDAVTDRLRARCRASSSPIHLRGLSVTRSSITAEFDDAWWDERARWRRRIDSALGARCKQTLFVGRLVDRIESTQRFVAHTPESSDDRALLAMMISR
jgi:hypothetical protein